MPTHTSGATLPVINCKTIQKTFSTGAELFEEVPWGELVDAVRMSGSPETVRQLLWKTIKPLRIENIFLSDSDGIIWDKCMHSIFDSPKR